MLWLKSESITVGGDGRVVRWRHPATTLEISASRNGVMIQGCSPQMDPEECGYVRKQLDVAVVIAGRLRNGSYERDLAADVPFPRGDFNGRAVQTGQCV